MKIELAAKSFNRWAKQNNIGTVDIELWLSTMDRDTCAAALQRVLDEYGFMAHVEA